MEPSRDAILAALANVIDPELRKPVTELDMVRDVEITGGEATVTIALTVAGCPLRNSFQEQVSREVGAVEGVTAVKLEFDVMSPAERTALTTKLRGGRPAADKAIQLEPTTRVIAVASGKGGVGKSSLTANLAAAFAATGRRVGILDADIYGHSIPHMLGISQKPVLVDKLMIPPVAHDLKLMSIGFFVDDNKPLMWRVADAAPGARAVPAGRALGRARPARRGHAAGHGRRVDLLPRPDAAARRGGRRDDAAGARAGGGEAAPRRWPAAPGCSSSAWSRT